jgi:uncharacterized protein with GYD domain
MALYVTLLKYSAEGIKGISSERFERQKSMIESKGGKLTAAYALFGEWDVLAIAEFPDEKSAMSVLVATGKAGLGTTNTMTAMPFEEFIKIGESA